MSKVITIFEVIPTKEGKEKYLELASNLKPLLQEAEGFIEAERFQSLNNPNKILSINSWENEEVMTNWRNKTEHRMSQLQGRTELFESYKITVVSVIREYTLNDHKNAPTDSKEYFDK